MNDNNEINSGIPDESEIKIKLNRDMMNASMIGIGRTEARFLVDLYYQAQDQRLANAGRVRSMENEPHAVLSKLLEWESQIEKQVKAVLGYYAEQQHMGRWAMQTVGIGPVIAAGLMAYIDIEQCPTVGHIWSFAGYNPKAKWLGADGAAELVGQVVPARKKPTTEDLMRIADLSGRSPKGVLKACSDQTRKKVIDWLAKRPWNASFKTLCWKIGESFVKVSNNPNDFYGKYYKQMKAKEEANNEAGMYADQAYAKAKKVGKDTEAYGYYSQGKLSPGHIHARCKRKAVKLFLAHWHGEAYREHFKCEPPLPYPIAHLGHAHLIEAPQTV